MPREISTLSFERGNATAGLVAETTMIGGPTQSLSMQTPAHNENCILWRTCRISNTNHCKFSI